MNGNSVVSPCSVRIRAPAARTWNEKVQPAKDQRACLAVFGRPGSARPENLRQAAFGWAGNPWVFPGRSPDRRSIAGGLGHPETVP